MTSSITVTYNIETTLGTFVSQATSNQLMLGQTLISFPSLTSLQQNFPSSNAFGCLSNDGSGNLSYTVLASSNLYGCSSTGNLSAITLGTGLSMATAVLNVTGAPPSGSAGGDLSGSYPNPVVGTNKVTYAKFVQGAATSLVGNPTGSLANAQDVTLNGTLSFTGTTLQREALTGDITASAGSNATTIATNAVTYAKFQQASAGNVVLCNPTASAANYSEVSLAASKLLGRGSTGNVAAITLGTNLSMSGATLNASGGAGTPQMLPATLGTTYGYEDNSMGNTGIGYQGLGTATVTGGNNVCFGDGAGTAIANCSNNTAIGYQSMHTESSNDNNVALGYQSLNNSDGNAGIVALGYQTMQSTTATRFNTAVGFRALQFVTNNYNTAIGGDALATLTSGGENVAVGFQAGENDSTMANCVAIGNNAMGLSSGNIQNTAIGHQVLYTATGTSFNCGVGHQALTACTGSQNTALGRTAGISLTSGNDNIFIGNGTDTTYTTDSNQIVIGSNTYANGANSITFSVSSTSFYATSVTSMTLGTLGSAAGTAVVQTAGGVLQLLTSSKRFKEDIEPMQIDSSKIYDLKPMEFILKDTKEKGFGFIAEDVFPILPEVVNLDKDNNPFSINYSHFSVLLIEELRKIRNEINQMRKL